MHIGLLECDHVAERFRHIAGGYREMFAELLKALREPRLRVTHYDICHGELPDSPDACAAYLCTGSQYSVYQDFEWVAALQQFVQRLHEAGKPYVGICFGHQMLARALGGQVALAPEGWGVGVQDMAILRDEPWMDPPRPKCRLQYMHADHVLRLPEGGVPLGRSEHCEVTMFRVGESMLGIQGHPEFTAAYTEALIRARIERIGAGRAQDALANLGQPTDAAVVAQWIAKFLDRAALSKGA
jgi:GMP synthase-like glutamine amidotransferase